MSKKEIKVDQEDIDQLLLVKQQKAKLLEEIKNIGVLEYNVEKRKKQARNFDEEITNYELTLSKSLVEKYGNGSVDTDKKIFIHSDSV